MYRICIYEDNKRDKRSCIKEILVDEQSDTFKKILDAMNQESNEKNGIVFLRSKRKMIPLHVDQIKYVESRKHDVLIYEEDTVHKFRMKMDECMRQLPDTFIRIHQSFAVNAHCISSFSKTKVFLESSEVLSISRNRYKLARAQLKALLDDETLLRIMRDQ